MISIDNAMLERVLKQLLISQQIEGGGKWSCLVFEIELLPRCPSGSSNPAHYDLVGTFTGYIEKGKSKTLRTLGKQIQAATESLHRDINNVGRLALSIRAITTDPHATQLSDIRSARLSPLKSHMAQGFEVLSTAPKRSRTKKKR